MRQRTQSPRTRDLLLLQQQASASRCMRPLPECACVSSVVRRRTRAEKLTVAEQRAAGLAGMYAPRTVQLWVPLILATVCAKLLANAAVAMYLLCCRRSACTLTTTDITTISSHPTGTSPPTGTSAFTFTSSSCTNTDGRVAHCGCIWPRVLLVQILFGRKFKSCFFTAQKPSTQMAGARSYFMARFCFSRPIFKKGVCTAQPCDRSLRHEWRERVRN